MGKGRLGWRRKKKDETFFQLGQSLISLEQIQDLLGFEVASRSQSDFFFFDFFGFAAASESSAL